MSRIRMVSHAYNRLVESGEISFDNNQWLTAKKLDQLAQILLGRPFWTGRRSGLFGKQSWRIPVKGFYIWGGVGRGKTFLMDLFVDSLPRSESIRLHFHRFMRDVHEQLTALQGIEDPLEVIADEYALKSKVLCLDECFVYDITDAMVLGTLFDALFRRGISLVTTSNFEPKNLYKDGLQRDRFLPTIDLIEMHCDVLNLDSDKNYRLRTLKHANLFFTPLDSDAFNALWELANALSSGDSSNEKRQIEINRRFLDVCFLADDLVWFDFDVLCGSGRAVPDYIEIARIFHTVILTGVPNLSRAGDDKARRFLNLVDELYDRSVNLLIGADVSLDELYKEGRLRFEISRCHSRLLEMQSMDYLNRPHKPE